MLCKILCFLFISFSFFSFAQSQEEQSTVSFSEGVTIFSSDEFFNLQISSGVVELANGNAVIVEQTDISLVIKSDVTNDNFDKKDHHVTVKNISLNPQKTEVDHKVKKIIRRFELHRKRFVPVYVNTFPASEVHISGKFSKKISVTNEHQFQLGKLLQNSSDAWINKVFLSSEKTKIGSTSECLHDHFISRFKFTRPPPAQT